MKTSQNKASTPTPFFNVHTEAMGNLCKIETRQGAQGEFAVLTFRMQEGHRDKLEFTFVTLTVAVDDDKALLQAHASSINSKTPVFVGLRMAGLKATPFVYPETSPNKGELGVNYSAKLMKIIYLKVGDQVVKQTQLNASSASHANTGNKPQASSGSFKPIFTSLQKSDANFEANKARLIAEGYRWHTGHRQWMLKTVNNLQIPRDELIKAGYVFKGDHWEGQFPSSKQHANQGTRASA